MDGIEELKDALALVRSFQCRLADIEERLKREIARRHGAERMRRHRSGSGGCKGSARRRAA